MIDEIGLIVALLLLLVFFNMAETSLTGASRPLMLQLAEEGNARAACVNTLRARGERLLGAIVLGNTLAAILASSLATAVAIDLAGNAGVAYGTAIMTVVVLIFGEILPKTVAIRRPNRVALALALFMRPVAWLFGPPVAVLQAGVDWVLRSLGLTLETTPNPEIAITELKGAIAIHAVTDEIRDEGKMMRSILDLGDVSVGEIMVHRRNLMTIDADLPVSQIIEQAAASPHTRIPIWRGEPDNIVGILHNKTLLRALRDHPGDACEAIDVAALATPPWYIPESTSLLDQMHAFRKRREYLALVVDEYGALQGVVTLEDILEEIVGEISHDAATAPGTARAPSAAPRAGEERPIEVTGVRRQPDGGYEIDGTVTIRDLNREFDWRLPDDNAATLAGLLLFEARMIPEQGQKFLFHGFRFEVLARTRNQVTKIRVNPPAEEKAEA